MSPPPDSGESSYAGSAKLKGRRALITGADSGIGRAVAIAFAREGAEIAISYLRSDEPDAKQVIKLIEEAGLMAVASPGDVSDPAFCNMYALFWIMHDAIPPLQPGASFINTASVHSYEPSPGIVDYAMTKAAIVALTKGW